uniref:ATP synthase F0 subunit 8 n=1 Tax=Campylaephora kondoi TaxID=218449 RepID=UPI002E79DD1A|nr:ATP synthase F0 subunit 8 [Campylaephora kondoi]WQF69477.1 ATP synthase F0 subunit 8 [Campylaephora kondoi]
MPQLDLTIIFPQIFWLCVLLSLFYYVLVYYLLPKFLVSLKIRKSILAENSEKLIGVSNLLSSNEVTFKKKLNLQLESLVKNFDDLNLVVKSSSKISKINIDNKFLVSTSNLVLFCDSVVSKNILFFPKFFRN